MNEDAQPPRTPLVAVVDDDESVRESVPALLRCRHCEVCTFSSAIEFLSSGALAAVDCLVLDIAMPQMTGLELQKELLARGNQIPIVFITALGDRATRTQILETGAIDCLLKPFSAEALLQAVEQALKPR